MKRIERNEAEQLFNIRRTTIAQNVKKEREKRGLTQVEFAYFINSHPATVSYAENGINKYGKPFIPSVHYLEKVAFVCCISLTDLMEKKNA